MIRARCRFLICCRDATVASWINFIHGLRTRHSYIGNVSLFTLVFLLRFFSYALCSLFLSCFLVFTLFFNAFLIFLSEIFSLACSIFLAFVHRNTHCWGGALCFYSGKILLSSLVRCSHRDAVELLGKPTTEKLCCCDYVHSLFT